jgi:RNA polymerase sigma factor (sigma-70 family)
LREKTAEEIDKLIQDNTGLVYTVLKNHYPHFQKSEDYIQTGMIGLWKAAKFYDPDIGTFSVYAYTIIHREIYRIWRYNARSKQGTFENSHLPFDSEIATSGCDSEIESNHFVDSTLKKIQSKNPRLAKIIIARMNGSTYQAIADEYGMSRQRIEQICKSAKKYIRRITSEAINSGKQNRS